MKEEKKLFVYTLKLNTTNKHVEQLNRRFKMAQDIFKKSLIECLRRDKASKKDPLYKQAMKHEASSKERKQILKELDKKYDLSDFSIRKFANDYRNARNYSHYIPSDVAISLGKRAWGAFSKVKFAKGANRISLNNPFTSMEGIHDAALTIRNGVFKMGTVTDKAKFSCPVIYEDDEMERDILRNKVKYCRLIRKQEHNKTNFYVQVVLEGYPHIKTAEPLDAKVGVDIGLTTVATSSRLGTNLEELAPDIDKNEKLIAKLQRKLDRQRRANNPNNYNPDRTIKKGRKTWHDSKNYLKTKKKLAELSRIQAEKRKLAHNNLANKLVEIGNEFVVEKMNFADLAKRLEDGEISKITGKNLSKKQFGKLIGRRSPAALIEKLRYKAEFRGSKFTLVDNEKIAATQLNHLDGEHHPIKLSERVKMVGEHPVQRDLYSAFILEHVTEGGENVDLKSCSKDFNRFLHNQEHTMDNLTNVTPSMGVKRFKAIKNKK